ncbi:MAG: hypothetical protein WA659_06985 [Candidatus Aquirickettsiella sp.]
MYKDIKKKIKSLRIHLVSVCNQLSKQIELKDEIIGFVKHSEEKLNRTLQQENTSRTMIDELTVKLADDQRLYAECKILIHEFRADIKATKKEIEKSKLKLHHIIFPQKLAVF